MVYSKWGACLLRLCTFYFTNLYYNRYGIATCQYSRCRFCPRLFSIRFFFWKIHPRQRFWTSIWISFQNYSAVRRLKKRSHLCLVLYSRDFWLRWSKQSWSASSTRWSLRKRSKLCASWFLSISALSLTGHWSQTSHLNCNACFRIGKIPLWKKNLLRLSAMRWSPLCLSY